MSFFRRNAAWLIPLVGTLFTAVLLHFIFFCGSNFGLWFSLSVIPPLVFMGAWTGEALLRRYPTRVGMLPYALFCGLFTGFLAAYAVHLALRYFSILSLGDKGIGFYLLTMSTMAITTVISAMYRLYFDLQDHFRLQNNAAALLKEAELYKLRQQLQPHFLYNSLNSINALIMLQPEKAQEMIGKLSDFLRSSVRKEAGDRIPLEDEIRYIDSYLAIESIRFGDRLKVVFEDDTPEGQFIPPFILQPILENAIKFSVYARTGAVTVSLSLKSENNVLAIVITNPFDRDAQPPSGTGFGLEGIRRRLFLLYSRNDLLETQQEETCFITTLKIPQ